MSKSGKNILQGIKNDNERLDNAYAALEDTIRKGRKKTFLKSEDASLDRPVALKYICDYMGIEAPSFDPYSLNSEAYITEVLRKNGVLSRPCVLTEGWYRNAVCVYLIRNRDAAFFAATDDNDFTACPGNCLCESFADVAG